MTVYTPTICIHSNNTGARIIPLLIYAHYYFAKSVQSMHIEQSYVQNDAYSTMCMLLLLFLILLYARVQYEMIEYKVIMKTFYAFINTKNRKSKKCWPNAVKPSN